MTTNLKNNEVKTLNCKRCGYKWITMNPNLYPVCPVCFNNWRTLSHYDQQVIDKNKKFSND